jgi:DNA repair photolyase
MTDEYQPVKHKFLISQCMLEVCLEPGFPMTVFSRLPLVLRNLDPLQAINERAVAVAMFSIISPNFPGYEHMHQMEHLAPRIESALRSWNRS